LFPAADEKSAAGLRAVMIPKLITYPARPIQGGRLELAPSKRGVWSIEPKLNGWRTLVHTPTGTMWNRHGSLLTIADCFRPALAALAKSFLLAQAVVERVSRLIDRDALQAMLRGVQVDLGARAAAEASAEALEAAIGGNGIAVAPHFDQKTERYQIKVERTRHGNMRLSTIDAEFLRSGDYQQIRQTAEMLRGLVGEGAHVQRADKKQPVGDFAEAMKWLLGEVERAMTLQRYKGLGEMNPAQLWETTMDPAVRRLLRVQIEDSIAADEIFTKLMGDEVEPRRAFIELNALGVRNLDV